MRCVGTQPPASQPPFLKATLTVSDAMKLSWTKYDIFLIDFKKDISIEDHVGLTIFIHYL